MSASTVLGPCEPRDSSRIFALLQSHCPAPGPLDGRRRCNQCRCSNSCLQLLTRATICHLECVSNSHEDYEYAAATLNQLDEVIGCAATERIWNVDSKPRWRDSFVLSGTDVGTERRAWRFTPDLAGSSEWNAAGQLVNGSVSMTPLDYVVPAAGTQRSGGGELTLHPVRFAINDTTVASDCSLSFPLGVVLPPTEHGALAPFGLWVIQPQRAGAPTVRCHGFPGVNEAWPPK
jgi:hypothetical protein|eukprot:COSAG06_NODE_13396_length_1261_cov_1.327883_2_plen_233_part_00